MEEKTMNEKKLIVEGYQPIINLQDGYKPTASVQNGKGQFPVSTPVAMTNVIPPQGGTGEVIKKNNNG